MSTKSVAYTGIFVCLVTLLLGAVLYQQLNRLIVAKRLQIEKLQELNAVQKKMLEDKSKRSAGLQNELTRLEMANDELQQTCVRRSDVVFVDDIPTRSMRAYCRKMAEGWKHVLPMLDKLGRDLGTNDE
jgi:hypothetical protein